MATIKNVEGQIRRKEGFNVRIRYGAPGPGKGRDVRGDRQAISGYSYARQRSGDDTVAAWITSRFAPNYGGLVVEVLDAAGKVVHGRTKLRNVRSSYKD